MMLTKDGVIWLLFLLSLQSQDLGLDPGLDTMWSLATPFTSLSYNFLTCETG